MAELVVALDMASGEEALALADRLPGLRWVKVGPVLFVREGPALVSALEGRGYHVFLDLKLHDIPSAVAGGVAAARDLGVSMTTVHALGGAAMMRAAALEAGEMAVVAVTILTGHDAAEVAAVFGRSDALEVAHEVDRLTDDALAAGLRGVVTSPLEAGRLRTRLGRDPWLVVPGIRAVGSAAGDQRRVATPREAVRAGATHLVVGRPITQAADPAGTFEELCADLEL
ncbi:MAG TPA: orotidine-5'-phosphate decarboxylase [Gemmatimonadales bacterium]|jgi:orotidine-5'-phosphate decarboxylase